MNIRLVIAALIVKHKLKRDDSDTVEMIQENIYIQYFCGFKSFPLLRISVNKGAAFWIIIIYELLKSVGPNLDCKRIILIV